MKLTDHERRALLLLRGGRTWISLDGRIRTSSRFDEMRVPGSTLKSLLRKGFIERCAVGARITALGEERVREMPV